MVKSWQSIESILSGKNRSLQARWLRLLLYWASVIYGCIVKIRNWYYDCGFNIKQAAVPVVSVGNLTVGGTGKTPVVEYIAKFYRAHGQRVCILSRGYGVDQGSNDEYLMLHELLPDVPHLQGVDRVDLARIACEELESELLILDDGFQHRKLKRDLNILLIDATNPWGYGYLLPRGLLREPSSELKRADLILITRVDQADPQQVVHRIKKIRPTVPIIKAKHTVTRLSRHDGQEADLSQLKDRLVAIFCAVGNPNAVVKTIESLGANILDTRFYPDHHEYTREDIDQLGQWMQNRTQDCWLITTHKDSVKLKIAEIDGHELWTIHIELKIVEGEELFNDQLLRLISSN